METGPVLEVRNLNSYYSMGLSIFGRKTARKQVLHDVTFHINHGEILGLVGESGCGKTTLSRTILGMLDDYGGDYDGEIIHHSKRPQMVFQDPAESLNQRQSIGQIVAEPFVIHRMGTPAARREWVRGLLDRVGLPDSAIDRFPFEFSGGQRQRIGIARALTLNPSLIILDEPVSALDVSVQSQVLNLLLELQEERKLSYLFIAHDLAVVKHISDRVAVMYLGKIVEMSDAETIYQSPKHAYTKALLDAIPEPAPPRANKPQPLPGDVPPPITPPLGSAFGHRIQHPSYPETVGADLTPVEIEPGHWVAPDPCALEPEDWNRIRQR